MLLRSEGGDGILAWDDIQHFVVIPNYKEDIDTLREALDTVVGSTIAETQITIVLAMEAREPDVETKTEILKAEYGPKCRRIMATYHPPKLPGELAGKSSNTKWAVERTWDWLDLNAEQNDIDQSKVVLTIADADTDFHPKFFEGLTYYFARLSDEERDVTIFQVRSSSRRFEWCSRR